MGEFEGKSCYYCGALAVSEEHAPPKQLFKGFLRDSIKVFSCAQHNDGKSYDDEVVIKGMMISLDQTAHRYPARSPRVLRAINFAKPYFGQVRNHVGTGKLMTDAPPDLDLSVAHFKGPAPVASWMRQLTAALVYDANEGFDPAIKWDEARVWSSGWVPDDVVPAPMQQMAAILKIKAQEAAQRDQLEWHDGWPSGHKNYPRELYYFHFHFAPTQIMCRHRFMNSYSWYVTFVASEATRANLSRKCGAS
jgi:hypothetical protein